VSREVDEKKTRKALRKIARARRAAEESGSEDTQLSEWEDEFIGSVEDRLNKFGSAFGDPEKGNLDEPLSGRQSSKLREIHKKTSGKARKPMSRGKGFAKSNSSFKPKTRASSSRSRDIYEDVDAPTNESEAQTKTSTAPPTKGFKPRIIDGGKSSD
jgi:hypothetical protein